MKSNIKKFHSIVLMLLIIITLTSCASRKILQYRSYGIDYLENENYEEALKYFDDAIKAGDGAVGKVQFDLLMYKAECLFMLKRYDEAQKIYDTLTKIDKYNKDYKELNQNIDSISNLVEFKKALDNNEIEKAEELFNKIKDAGLEHEKSVMFNQAVLYEKKAEWKNALNAFNYYLKQYPGDEDAMHEVEFINSQLTNAD